MVPQKQLVLSTLLIMIRQQQHRRRRDYIGSCARKITVVPIRNLFKSFFRKNNIKFAHITIAYYYQLTAKPVNNIAVVIRKSGRTKVLHFRVRNIFGNDCPYICRQILHTRVKLLRLNVHFFTSRGRLIFWTIRHGILQISFWFILVLCFVCFLSCIQS